MHTRFLSILSILGALTWTAGAQSPIAKASVPFEFAAGGAMMPPGEYMVDIPDLSGVILLHGSAGNSVALLTTFAGESPVATTARLLFERRDGVTYLSAVEWPGETAQVRSAFKRVTKGAVAAALH